MVAYGRVTSTISSTKFSPYQVIDGVPQRRLPSYSSLNRYHGEAEEFLYNREEVLLLLKENLCESQNKMKQRADLRRAEREFKVGDFVYLRLQPYRQTSVNFRRNTKLAPRFYGAQ